MSLRGGGGSESTMPSTFRKGYSPFNREPTQYHCRIMLERSLTYEDGLVKVTPGIEIAPAALGEDANQL